MLWIRHYRHNVQLQTGVIYYCDRGYDVYTFSSLVTSTYWHIRLMTPFHAFRVCLFFLSFFIDNSRHFLPHLAQGVDSRSVDLLVVQSCGLTGRFAALSTQRVNFGSLDRLVSSHCALGIGVRGGVLVLTCYATVSPSEPKSVVG